MHRVRWAKYSRLRFRGFLVASVLLCTAQVTFGQKPDKSNDDSGYRPAPSANVKGDVQALPIDAPAGSKVVVVALDEPAGPAHGGGDVAAPLLAQVATAGLGRLGIVTAPEPIPARPFPTAVAVAKPEARAGAKIKTAGAIRAPAASTPDRSSASASVPVALSITSAWPGAALNRNVVDKSPVAARASSSWSIGP